MKFSNPYWSTKLKIQVLQRWILVHSTLYYELNETIVSDKMFDDNAQLLVRMQNDFPQDAEKTRYWYVFYDFDGSTGYDLFSRLSTMDQEWHMEIAQSLIKQFKEEEK